MSDVLKQVKPRIERADYRLTGPMPRPSLLLSEDGDFRLFEFFSCREQYLEDHPKGTLAHLLLTALLDLEAVFHDLALPEHHGPFVVALNKYHHFNGNREGLPECENMNLVHLTWMNIRISFIQGLHDSYSYGWRAIPLIMQNIGYLKFQAGADFEEMARQSAIAKKFDGGRGMGDYSPLRKAMIKELTNNPKLSNDDLWEVIRKNPPSRHKLASTMATGRYVEIEKYRKDVLQIKSSNWENFKNTASKVRNEDLKK